MSRCHVSEGLQEITGNQRWRKAEKGFTEQDLHRMQYLSLKCHRNPSTYQPSVSCPSVSKFHLCPPLFTAVSVSLKDLFESNSRSESISVPHIPQKSEYYCWLKSHFFLWFFQPKRQTTWPCVWYVAVDNNQKGMKAVEMDLWWLLNCTFKFQRKSGSTSNKNNSPEFHIRWHRYW